MRDLARKYRPAKLTDVYGQPKAVDTIRHHTRHGTNKPLLFVGPPGTGKTSAARIIGATRICDDEEADDPCGVCPNCKSVLFHGGGAFGWFEMDCAQHSARDEAVEAAKLIGANSALAWTIFLDEIHALDNDAADALLKAVESPGIHAQFIAATTDRSAVRLALRSRCVTVPFVPLSGAQGFALLRDVCDREAIPHEPQALDMIASASSGSARDALIKLDEIARQGPVTPALVAETLAFGTVGPLLAFFDGIIAGDPAKQYSALYNWQAAPAEKARLIRAYLLQIYQSDLATSALDHMVDPAFYEITKMDRGRLIAGISARTGGRELQGFWLDLLDQWQFDPSQISDEAALAIKAHRFHRMLHGSGVAAVTGPVPVMPVAPSPEPRRRATKRQRGPAEESTRACHLSRAQAEAIYDAATMLPQEYGVLFNASLHFDHERLGDGTERAAQSLVSSLTHELALRTKSWVRGHALHWAYVHERRAGGIRTELVLHIPAGALARAEEWVHRRMGQWRSGASEPGAYQFDLPKESVTSGPAERRVSRHWRLVRRLWRGVDPTLRCWGTDWRRTSLVELLGVPATHRSDLGHLDELRRYQLSASLGPKSRGIAEAERMTLLSAFADGAWSAIDTGWELRETADRQRERVDRADQVERVKLEWSDSSNPIEVQRRNEDLAQLRASWPLDPHRRMRSWKGWW